MEKWNQHRNLLWNLLWNLLFNVKITTTESYNVLKCALQISPAGYHLKNYDLKV